LTHSNATVYSGQSFDMAAVAANVAESKKSFDVTILDISHVSSIADYFVICSGDTPVQVRTILDAIEQHFRKRGTTPINPLDYAKASRWCLLDYGDVVVHIMHQAERSHYQLEEFWNHATLVPKTAWENSTMQEAS
jgi:ribosome-associated protein